MQNKITDIVITDALGCYGYPARRILESMGFRVWILDENDNRRQETDFLNYESLIDLPDNFAIWSLSDRATRILSANPDKYSKAIFTHINNLEEFVDKANYSDNFPTVPFIRYPKVKKIDLEEKKWIFKPTKGSGTSIDNGRAKLLTPDTEYALFQYVPHDKEQVVLARFEEGVLKETVFYQGMVTEPWSKAKPNEVIVSESNQQNIIKWLELLGEHYQIDGIIDAEFMISGEYLYFSESNPRQNGQSYWIAKPMIKRFLTRAISRL